ncbi:hypothetical protein HLB27_08745 [Dickeya dadantii]|uniref:hypothetical protein n=1 Tax=Dickeya dadantii TaxID=204038 RepID=UPI0014958CA8|nr:hypothetical protein [Dickeya dadantii]NPE60518.1 hypothetical protein [Dickeya dadantii]NPE70730.1 hypothetical protein [Dickeya dadantii]
MIDNLNIFSGGPEERRRIFRKKIRYGSVRPAGRAKKSPFFTLPAPLFYIAAL